MSRNNKSENLEDQMARHHEREKLELKDSEIALVAELIRNSRRSDRELSKAIGVSQPTVSRIIRKLEQNGVVSEYTMIPNLQKLGYSLCALIFLKLKERPAGDIGKIREAVRESLGKSRFVILMLERGIGYEHDAVMVCLYKDYSSYVEHINVIKQFPYITPDKVDSFLIDLNDEVHYRYLTFSSLTRDLQRSTEENEQRPKKQAC